MIAWNSRARSSFSSSIIRWRVIGASAFVSGFGAALAGLFFVGTVAPPLGEHSCKIRSEHLQAKPGSAIIGPLTPLPIRELAMDRRGSTLSGIPIRQETKRKGGFEHDSWEKSCQRGLRPAVPRGGRGVALAGHGERAGRQTRGRRGEGRHQ